MSDKVNQSLNPLKLILWSCFIGFSVVAQNNCRKCIDDLYSHNDFFTEELLNNISNCCALFYDCEKSWCVDVLG